MVNARIIPINNIRTPQHNATNDPNAAETGLKSASGWDEKEDYIRKDSTEEVEETKKEAPETDQREGEYKIPPPE